MVETERVAQQVMGSLERTSLLELLDPTTSAMHGDVEALINGDVTCLIVGQICLNYAFSKICRWRVPFSSRSSASARNSVVIMKENLECYSRTSVGIQASIDSTHSSSLEHAPHF